MPNNKKMLAKAGVLPTADVSWEVAKSMAVDCKEWRSLVAQCFQREQEDLSHLRRNST